MDYKIVDNFLTPDKCQELIDLSESMGYVEADISYPEGGRMNKQYRDNSRVLLRDEDLRIFLENLIKPHVPQSLNYIEQGGVVRKLPFIKLSGNFRFYKYEPGQKFKKHRDANQLEEGGVSLITVLIYLNDAEEGGETAIYDYTLPDRLLVKVETGRMLMFDHSVAHTGEELKKGTKYVLRTDLIYNI